MSWRDITGAAKAAAIFAGLSFIISVTYLSTSSRNGVGSCRFMDCGALAFGALAVLAGLVALARPGTGENANVNRIIGAAALLIGLYRAGYGLGLVGGPC